MGGQSLSGKGGQVRMQVHPTRYGWQLSCDLPIETTYYPSGARAEVAARNLALRLSDVGHDVQVEIQNLDSQVVGTQIFFAAEPPSAVRADIDGPAGGPAERTPARQDWSGEGSYRPGG